MCTEKIIFMAGNTHEYVAKEGSCDLFCRRAPHGARGLKHCSHKAFRLFLAIVSGFFRNCEIEHRKRLRVVLKRVILSLVA